LTEFQRIFKLIGLDFICFTSV